MFSRTLTEFLIAGVSSFVLTAILSHFIIPILVAKKAGQPIREEGPASHYSKEGTPTMGGISFIIAILLVALGMAIYYLCIGEQRRFIPVGLTLALAVFNGMIGFYDDYKKLSQRKNEGLKARHKFVLQTIAAIVYVVMLVLFGGIDTTVNVPFLDKTVDLGIFYYFFAVVLIVGVVNGVNLNDGLDGLASSVTLTIAIFFAVVLFTIESISVNSVAISFVSAALIGATSGFLIYNHHPAKVFMGDTGSLFLGGMLVGAAFIIDQPMIIVIAGGVFMLEVISDIIQVSVYKLTRRFSRDHKPRKVFRCAPLHHHFQEGGWSEVKVVVVFTIASVIFCGISWLGLYL